MTKFGFEVYAFEWWHFDLQNWKHYPPLDIDFTQVASTWWLLSPPSRES